MDARERIETAVRLGKPDRVPVVPIIDFFAGRYGGINQHDMFFDIDKADAALERTLHDLGPIDGQNLSYAGLGRIMQLIFPTPPVMPGVGEEPPDGQFQFVERTVMGPEEYRLIGERGPLRWILDKMRLSTPELGSPAGLLKAFAGAGRDIMKVRRSMKRWQRKGVESMVAYNIVFTPMEYISLFMRSFNEFVLDLFRRPDDVKAASRALMKTMQMQGLMMVRMSGLKRVFMGGTRTSASFLSPRQFEELALPEWQEMCEFWVRRGVTPLLHFDSDWTAFFPYLKELPRGKCILNLDGTSDIFKAKEILGDHMCIMGDVPAAATGSGALENGDAHIYLGTSGWLVITVAKPKNLGKNGIVSVVSADPEMFMMIGETETAGACLKWFADNFANAEERERAARREDEMAIFAVLDEVVEGVEPGAGRLLFTPWLFGERAPITDTTLRAAFVNLSLGHEREHMLRAIYEGVAYNFRWLVDAVAGAGFPCRTLRAIGGGARSDVWMQIMADVTRRTVEAVADPQEAGAMGCALAVAAALREYGSYRDLKKVIRVRRTFEPDPQCCAEYDELYGVFRALYGNLTGICRRLNEPGQACEAPGVDRGK